jgi:hypothetical protein
MTGAVRIAELEKENAELARKVAEQARKVAEQARKIAEQAKELAGLRDELVRLRKEIEEWRRGHRERSKRRSSRAEGASATSGKKPGRKAGHEGAFRPEPKRVDRTVRHPMPKRCACGGCVEPTSEEDSTVVEDIPPVQVVCTKHVTQVGRCKKCGRRVATKLPGATAGGNRVASVVIGPHAQALMVSLRFEGKMTMPAISATMRTWFGLSISPGGLVQMFHRIGERGAPSYDEIAAHIRQAAVVGLDETGLHQDGLGGWAWLARTDQASLFRIELSRASWVAEQMLGAGFVGVVCTDFYSVYTRRDDWTHGYCGAHVIREAKKIAEVSPTDQSVEFRDRLQAFYRDAREAQRTQDPSAKHGIRIRLGQIVANTTLGLHADVARLQGRLDKHFYGVLTFLERPDVPADNNATERDIRALAQYRKVTGGTRSPQGSLTLARLMSISQTLRKNDLPLRDWVVGAHDAHLQGRAPPSVFAPS